MITIKAGLGRMVQVEAGDLGHTEGIFERDSICDVLHVEPQASKYDIRVARSGSETMGAQPLRDGDIVFLSKKADEKGILA